MLLLEFGKIEVNISAMSSGEKKGGKGKAPSRPRQSKGVNEFLCMFVFSAVLQCWFFFLVFFSFNLEKLLRLVKIQLPSKFGRLLLAKFKCQDNLSLSKLMFPLFIFASKLRCLCGGPYLSI